MRKIIFCLLLFNVLFFTFGTSFVNADGIVNLNSFKQCPDDPNPGSDRLWKIVIGSTNCKVGSYYYTKDVPVPGNLIYSSVYSDFRSLNYIYFNGVGTIDILDKDNNLIKTLNVSTQERVRLYVGNLNGYKFKYTGIDLLGVKFSWNRKALTICYAKEGFTDVNHKFYVSASSVSIEDVEQQPEQQPQQPEQSDCDICSKIDSILEELKKGNGCDVCSKLSGILQDTNKINNNISQLKITTGYINSHLSQIKDNISDNSLILAKVRQTLDTMRMQDLDRNDSLDSIDNKLDNLESIDNNLEGIKDEIDTIVDDFAPTIIPDFSGQIQKPDLPVLDIPTIKKQEDTNVYFSEQEFEGEASPFPFAEGPKPWKNVDGKEIVIEDFDRDSPFDKDKSLIRDDSMKSEKMERDEPLQREEMDRDEIKRDEPLEVEKPLKRDEPLELKEMDRDEINRDEPLEVEKFLRRDEPLEVEEN